MLKFTEDQFDEAMDRAVDRCIHIESTAERIGPIRRAALEEGIAMAVAAFAWSEVAPTEPGLFAVSECGGEAGLGRLSVCSVELHEPTGELIYGGIRRVADAPNGTLWHRLSPLPS